MAPSDAAYLGYTFSKVAAAPGFHVLAQISPRSIFPYQGIGIVARKSFLDQSPDIAERTAQSAEPSRSPTFRTPRINRAPLGFS